LFTNAVNIRTYRVRNIPTTAAVQYTYLTDKLLKDVVEDAKTKHQLSRSRKKSPSTFNICLYWCTFRRVYDLADYHFSHLHVAYGLFMYTHSHDAVL